MLAEGVEGECEVDGSGEDGVEFVATGSDAAEALELPEGLLDLVALPVERAVVSPRLVIGYPAERGEVAGGVSSSQAADRLRPRRSRHSRISSWSTPVRLPTGSSPVISSSAYRQKPRLASKSRRIQGTTPRPIAAISRCRPYDGCGPRTSWPGSAPVSSSSSSTTSPRMIVAL